MEEVGGRRRDADEAEDEDEETEVVIFLAAAAAAGTADVARHALGGAAKRNHGRATASQ